MLQRQPSGAQLLESRRQVVPQAARLVDMGDCIDMNECLIRPKKIQECIYADQRRNRCNQHVLASPNSTAHQEILAFFAYLGRFCLAFDGETAHKPLNL